MSEVTAPKSRYGEYLVPYNEFCSILYTPIGRNKAGQIVPISRMTEEDLEAEREAQEKFEGKK